MFNSDKKTSRRSKPRRRDASAGGTADVYSQRSNRRADVQNQRKRRRRVLLSALLTVQVTTRIERKLLKGMGALALQCQ